MDNIGHENRYVGLEEDNFIEVYGNRYLKSELKEGEKILAYSEIHKTIYLTKKMGFLCIEITEGGSTKTNLYPSDAQITINGNNTTIVADTVIKFSY